MNRKRADLQAIRGIAIVAVLLFHFFPDWFPNGYIGVDQFFVLSGYLIAMILSGTELDRGTILAFYYRRIRRIVPLYLLVVLLILISMFIFFPPINIDLNMESSRYALSFTTNYQGFSSSKQYAVMLHLAVDAFTHTWSLAVEMQFYLLVPFIFFISNKFGHKLVVVIGSASLLYNISVDDDTAFNSVFARLWQFCIGIGSFMLVRPIQKTPDLDSATENLLEDNLEDNCNNYGKSRELKSMRGLVVIFLYSCLSFTLVQELNCIVIEPMLLRPSVSLLTGALIVLGFEDTIFPMNNRILVYMGDISYALYLVHWPLYSYARLEYRDNMEALCLALFVSVFLAVLITETYEKCYLKMEKSSVLSLIGILYGLCFAVLIYHCRRAENVEEFKVDLDMYRNITKEHAILLNEQFNKNDQSQLWPPSCEYINGICVFKRSDKISSDKPSLLILGNSYAGNQGEMVYESCNSSTSRIVLHWGVACEVLIPYRLEDPRVREWCSTQVTDGYLEIARREKPDILFILVRYLQLATAFQPNVSIADDPFYKEALIRLHKYEEYVSKTIYLLDGVRFSHVEIVEMLNNGLRSGKMPNMVKLISDFAKFRKVRIFHADLVDPAVIRKSEFAEPRLAELVRNCKKCQMIDYEPYLTVDGEFQFYDTSNGLSYFTLAHHLTPYGLSKVQPLFKRLCGSF